MSTRRVALFAALLIVGCSSEGDVLVSKPPALGAIPEEDVLLRVDFEQTPVGTYSEDLVRDDWGDVPWVDGGNVSIVEDARGRVLRASYPQGSVGPLEGGGQWLVPLGSGADVVVASFKVRFKLDFDWVEGGLLPGLAGGTANTAQNVPDGTDGFTARAEWRPDGTLNHFVYHPDQEASYGDKFLWDPAPVLQSDRWYQITQRIEMNTPGQADGLMEVWLDDQLVLSRADLRLRTVPDLVVDRFYFSTFFGGSGDQYQASRDEYADFDDFLVWKE